MLERNSNSSQGKQEPTRRQRGRERQHAQNQPGEFQSSPQIRTALIAGNTFRAKAVQYAVVDGLAMFEGDIILGTVEEVERKSKQLRDEMTGAIVSGIVITGAQYRWPDCTIPYTIDSSLTNQTRVTDAIAHWEANTPFRFAQRTSEADYVIFQPGSGGCSSYVGRQGGQQPVNLAAGCTTGSTIHEIGHAVGMWHEHSREDRDSFVTIHWDKIEQGYEHNFNQHITDGDDVGPYDYGSIMHYPRDAFSIDGSDTITPIDPNAQIGQRNGLSAGDIAAANSLCPGPKLVKEIPKDTRWDTIKEMVKDVRFDTRKEVITDTLKEQIKERIKEQIKEQIKDRIKDVALDPPYRKPSLDRRYPGVVQPLPIQPGTRPRGRLPFAVATPHQAPGTIGERDQLQDMVAAVDAELQMLADQLAELESTRAMLQAQYDETAELLRRSVEEHDQALNP